MRKPTDLVLLIVLHRPLQKKVPITLVVIVQPGAALRFFLSPRPGTGHTSAQCARRVLNICLNSHDMKEFTLEKNPLNVIYVTKHSASRHIYNITSALIAMRGHSNVPFVKRVSSTAPIWSVTCMSTRENTCSNAIYVSCTSRSPQSSCITRATHRVHGLFVVLLVVKGLNVPLIFGSMSAHTLRSGLSTVTSVR